MLIVIIVYKKLFFRSGDAKQKIDSVIVEHASYFIHTIRDKDGVAFDVNVIKF